MSKFVLIKDGGNTPSLFSDFTQAANTKNNFDDETIHVDFFTRMDYSLRLVKNRTPSHTDHKIALTHYAVNQLYVEAGDVEAASHFRPIDFPKMFEALEKYEYVMFGYYSNVSLITDYTIVNTAIYAARDDTGSLINVDTGERLPIKPGIATVWFTCLFSITKLKGLPIYYLMLDPSLVRVGDDLELLDVKNDIQFIVLTEHDGSYKHNVFAPSFDSNVVRVGDNVLLTSSDTITITFFGAANPISLREGLQQVTSLPPVDIQTSFPYTIESKTLSIKVNNRIGFLKVEFDVNRVLNNSLTEYPRYDYTIFRIGEESNDTTNSNDIGLQNSV